MGIDDEELLEQAEGLDGDETGTADDVWDPPDRWSAADRFGTTERESNEGESLEQRLAQEKPDVQE